jgi:hypothetical protein
MAGLGRWGAARYAGGLVVVGLFVVTSCSGVQPKHPTAAVQAWYQGRVPSDLLALAEAKNAARHAWDDNTTTNTTCANVAKAVAVLQHDPPMPGRDGTYLKKDLSSFAVPVSFCYQWARKTATGNTVKDDESDPDYMESSWVRVWSALVAAKLPVSIDLGTPSTT